MDNFPTIVEFFAGKDIFITGGSGFMGKALIEKLLRSCPDINKIFILIRPKKGKEASERLDILKSQSVYNRLKDENPSALNKMVAIAGDVTLIGLGLSEESFKQMENVSVIFHSAASVRFDDYLKDAIILNTRGTREVCRLAEKLKKLDVLLHVSTTYANCDSTTVREELYPPKADWVDAIKIAETLDNDSLNALTAKFTNFAPNTYTFTKSLGEHVVDSFKDRINAVIFRPSIVISALDEPMPGWLDNFNGPVGLLSACGIGIMRTSFGNPDVVADYTPVDIAIKAMIACAWKHGYTKPKQLDIYNCSTSNVRRITMGELIDMGREITLEIPLDKLIWAPNGSITTNRVVNYVRVILLHILPAVILDQALQFSGKKPFLVKLQRKIYTANMALEYFIINEWTFEHKRFMGLVDDIKLADQEKFQFNSYVNRDIKTYFSNAVLGARRYLFNEKDSNIPHMKKKLQRLILIDKIVKGVFYSGIFYYSLVMIGPYIGSHFMSTSS